MFLTYVYDEEIPEIKVRDLLISGGSLVKMIDLILDIPGGMAQLALNWLTKGAIKELYE
jgi:hypothetical protein